MPKPRNLGRLRYVIGGVVDIVSDAAETMKIGGERSATCRGCAVFSTRRMPKPRNLGRLRYVIGGVVDVVSGVAETMKSRRRG